MIHPDLHQWQQAKKSALLIAATIPNCEIVQTPDGKTKRVILGKKITDCTSWYAAYCYLHRIKLDMIGHGQQPRQEAPPKPAQQAKPPPLPPMAIILPD